MPQDCERVYHPEWGWGVIETYYTNPDGTAILPYHREIGRQSTEKRELIYALAKDMLEKLIAAGALFYEPGNLHVLNKPDGGIELRIVDFEPESKTLVPLEVYCKWYRRRKLMRKAKRFLSNVRKRYGVRDVTIQQLRGELVDGRTGI